MAAQLVGPVCPHVHLHVRAVAATVLQRARGFAAAAHSCSMRLGWGHGPSSQVPHTQAGPAPTSKTTPKLLLQLLLMLTPIHKAVAILGQRMHPTHRENGQDVPPDHHAAAEVRGRYA